MQITLSILRRLGHVASYQGLLLSRKSEDLPDLFVRSAISGFDADSQGHGPNSVAEVSALLDSHKSTPATMKTTIEVAPNHPPGEFWLLEGKALDTQIAALSFPQSSLEKAGDALLRQDVRPHERWKAVEELVNACSREATRTRATELLLKALGKARQAMPPEEFSKFRALVIYKLAEELNRNPQEYRSLATHVSQTQGVKFTERTRDVMLGELGRRLAENQDPEALELLKSRLKTADINERATIYRQLTRAAQSTDPRSQLLATEALKTLSRDSTFSEHRREALKALLASPEALQVRDLEELSGRLKELDYEDRLWAHRMLTTAAERLLPSGRPLSEAERRSKDVLLKEMREMMQRHPQAVTSLLKKLSHLLGPTDYESIASNLTPEGLKLLEQAIASEALQPRQLVANLSTTKRPSDETWKLLERYNKSLDGIALRALLQAGAPQSLLLKLAQDEARPLTERASVIRHLARGDELPEALGLEDLKEMAEATGEPLDKANFQRHRVRLLQKTRQEMLKVVEEAMRKLGPLDRAQDREKLLKLQAMKRAIVLATDPNSSSQTDKDQPDRKNPLAPLVHELLYNSGKDLVVQGLEDQFKAPGSFLKSVRSAALGMLVNLGLDEVLGSSAEEVMAKDFLSHLISSGGRLWSLGNIFGLVLEGYIRGAVQGFRAIGKLHDTVNQAFTTRYLADLIRGRTPVLSPKIREFVETNRTGIEDLTGEKVDFSNLSDYLKRHAGVLILVYGQAGNAGTRGVPTPTNYDPVPELARKALLNG
ncbi:MAG: hypothetical protein KC800_24575 [Candidatus Eremiobacteraeota bacterium]|nr:hypothetical protein [Candidatus Eremiobacteraeota bacterium]